MTDKAKIIYFPKKCPKCGYPLRYCQKMSGWFYSCEKCEDEEYNLWP